jgi:hypothetical protein
MIRLSRSDHSGFLSERTLSLHLKPDRTGSLSMVQRSSTGSVQLRPLLLRGIVVCLFIPACGGEQEEFRFEVHPVEGQITQKGKPVARAFVRFHPLDPSSTKIPEGREGPEVLLTTETDPDGRFVMSTYLADDGVPAGKYAVTVGNGLSESEVDVENSDSRSVAADRRKTSINPLFRDPATTPLRAEIKPGENHLAFEVK